MYLYCNVFVATWAFVGLMITGVPKVFNISFLQLNELNSEDHSGAICRGEEDNELCFVLNLDVFHVHGTVS